MTQEGSTGRSGLHGMIAVLYVDDEPALLELGKRFLERTGQLAVDTLLSAHEALMVIGEKEYDAIVSDYLMPGMNGIEFLAEIRASGNTIPFIIFTGRGREDVIIEAINTGVDFYLQKGGDPASQFAELEHKIRQAVQQRRAEAQIRDYERREADILDFLPDATLAIDTRGVVIAWNRAMEEMTGVPAEEMLGKGDYKYALPFYGERRPILIDLIFSDPGEIRARYASIVRNGTTIAAETVLPRLRGEPRTLWGKASLLFNQSGNVVGAIEVIRDLTVRKQAEETLRASESRLRYMLGFSEMADRREHEILAYAIKGAGMVTGSPLGYLAFANNEETELRMYAWSMAAMKECSLQEKPLVYPLEKTGLWGEAVRQRRPVITNDYAAPNPAKKGYPDGHPPVIRHMNIPVFDGDRIVIVAGVANKPSDYTDDDVRQLTLLMQGLWQVLKRRRAEDELRAANEQLTASDEELRSQLDELARAQEERARTEQNFRMLVDNAPDPIYIHTHGRFVYLNTAALRLFGASSAGDMIVGDLYDRVHPLFHDLVRQRVRTLTVDVTPAPPLEERYLKLDGTPVDVEVTAVPVMYGGESGVLEMLRDITERKEAERALRESESKYRELAEMLPQIVFEMDRDQMINFVNRQAYLLLGYTEEDMSSGFNALTVIHPSNRDRARENLRKAAIGEPFEHLEYTIVRKDGSTFPAFIYIVPVFTGTDLAGFRGIIVDITERKKALEALRGSEATIESIFRAAPVGIGLVRDRVIVRVNDRIAEMTGYAPEELVGKSARILYPDDEEFAFVGREKYDQIRERGTGTVETCWKRKDGSIRDILLSSTPLDPRNHAEGVTFTALDITDRKRGERALLESEEKYRALVEATSDFIWETDAAGVYTYASPQIRGMLGYEPDDLIGRTPFDLMPPDEAERVGAAFRQYMEVHLPIITIENRNVRRDGSEAIFETSAVPRFGRDGRFGGYRCIDRDITGRKRAEEALREREEQYRSVIENIEDGFVRTDRDGRLVMVSPSVARLAGYASADDLVGQPVVSIYRSPEARLNLLEEMKKTGSVHDYEIEFRRRDGSLFWGSISAHFLYDEDGAVSGTEAVIRDITERKNMENALRLANRKLLLLASTTRHDMVNQVTVLQGYLGLSRDRMADPEALLACIDWEEQAATRISSLLQFMKEYEQIGINAPVWEDIRSLVETAAGQVVPGDIMVECMIPAGYDVLADPLIARVFYNLMENAIRHGGSIMTIRFSVSDRGESSCIVCEDDGSGIPAGEKEKIFEQGFGKGTGLGLFLSREILAITGITIRETGEPGRGARFEITVPTGAWRVRDAPEPPRPV